MNILALDTSSHWCSVALQTKTECLSDRIEAKQQHSALLMPMISKILLEVGITLAEIDGIAFGAGPGSFTGLRIACGVTQGLAFALDCPVYGVSTLLALAQASQASQVIIAIDARMQEVYHAIYQRNAQNIWEEIGTSQVCMPTEAPLPPPYSGSWIGIGSGFLIYPSLHTHYGVQLEGIFPDLVPDAQYIAQLAFPFFEQGLGKAAIEAQPIYIRNKVARKMHE